jgi:hypothetical protein
MTSAIREVIASVTSRIDAKPSRIDSIPLRIDSIPLRISTILHFFHSILEGTQAKNKGIACIRHVTSDITSRINPKKESIADIREGTSKKKEGTSDVMSQIFTKGSFLILTNTQKQAQTIGFGGGSCIFVGKN